MNKLVAGAIQQPITVAVGVILALLAGIIAISRVPVQMTPEVDDLVIAVTTTWENASPQEVETEVIDEQEKRLQGISGLVSMTSVSQAGRGQIRLQFRTGTNKDAALAEVGEKLREVPEYPQNVDEPEIDDIDPDNVDYIAWIGLASSDPKFDASTLFDFMEKRLKPRFERILGISEVGIRGAREREVQIQIDPVRLAQRSITLTQLYESINLTNDNFSAGSLPEGKSDIRVRVLGRFNNVENVRNTVIRRDDAGPIYIRDVADVVVTNKELTEWVRARGHRMPFFNFQREQGSNLLVVMDALKAEVERLNAPGGILDRRAKELGLNGKLELVQTYDQTVYVDQALELVQNNIIVGGVLAVLTLLLFLRSLRTIGIIAIAIPISVISSIVLLVSLGRSINIISLAGMAFSTGMVVDNAIVVIENIFRHLEMGKGKKEAALDGTKEVAGAVVASTLTTLVVFFPILLIQESAGQLFRDIAIAISAAVGLSLIVSITVIPAAASRILRINQSSKTKAEALHKLERKQSTPFQLLRSLLRIFTDLPGLIGNFIFRVNGSYIARLLIGLMFFVVTMGGIYLLLPPIDYLPRGNRNIVFGILIPPPGYNVEQLSEIGKRLEDRIRPAWQVTPTKFQVERIDGNNSSSPQDNRKPIPSGFQPNSPKVIPPELDHYFLVAWEGRIFQVAITSETDSKRVIDTIPLFNYSTAGEAAPGVISFAFQFPLFRLGGRTGSAVKVDLAGPDLSDVNQSAAALLGQLIQNFGPYAIQPEPANFMLPSPELQVVPVDERLRELSMARRDLGLVVQAHGDGLFVGKYEIEGELKDLKIITRDALGKNPLTALQEAKFATPRGDVIDLQSVALLKRVVEPHQIKRVGRQRAVTLQFTPPPGMPLQSAIDEINGMITDLQGKDQVKPNVEINLAGSAGKLAEIRRALLGDGTLLGTITSSLFLALLIVYLLMVILFQSWINPLVIMISVPLATFGGFLGLAIVHQWSVADRYMPVQNLDVLTILGFIILAGVVVNNAILIVHQTLNFMSGESDEGEQKAPMYPREAIAESVKSRVRPIMMSTLTSVGGMLPLVLIPGSGSELYRGLGAVVLGGLLVSTVFTLVLVPIVLSLVFDIRSLWRSERSSTV